ncbi:MAG: tRNA (cytidine(56)-2'-O)-methyltransferase [Candidatus Helarchaeota archaeon]|nr:tRNA (cytidine(56)-2'-O)-methyltransferase [Candidatus Helarchaeota archaeon]
MKVVVLRLGHRFERDKRISTHIGLVARAFGADGIIISDISDSAVEESILDIRDRFGGKFFVEMGEKWHTVLKNWKSSGGEIIHLTMYGIPIPQVIEKIRGSQKQKLIVVGASKVPRDVYELADYNVSITSQPHSEVAALAIFLDYLFQGSEFNLKFPDAKMEVIPSEKGKTVRDIRESGK